MKKKGKNRKVAQQLKASLRTKNIREKGSGVGRREDDQGAIRFVRKIEQEGKSMKKKKKEGRGKKGGGKTEEEGGEKREKRG